MKGVCSTSSSYAGIGVDVDGSMRFKSGSASRHAGGSVGVCLTFHVTAGFGVLGGGHR